MELIVSNKPVAGVLQIAKEYSIESLVISRKSFNDSDILDKRLVAMQIDLIILAGFLWLIPERLIKLFPSRIINIHPALLPKYGGKGMFGSHVHEAVKKAQELESGITIHSIDEKYDEGNIIFQQSIPLDASYSASDIAENVLKLEHYYYPRVIEKLLFEKKQ